jgi:hypothetical protein
MQAAGAATPADGGDVSGGECVYPVPTLRPSSCRRVTRASGPRRAASPQLFCRRGICVCVLAADAAAAALGGAAGLFSPVELSVEVRVVGRCASLARGALNSVETDHIPARTVALCCTARDVPRLSRVLWRGALQHARAHPPPRARRQ